MLGLKQAERQGLGRLTTHVKYDERRKANKSTFSVKCSRADIGKILSQLQYAHKCEIVKTYWNGKKFVFG